MADEAAQPSYPRSGIYDRSMLEVPNVDKIEASKTNYLLTFSGFTSMEKATEDLLSIVDTMSNFIDKYFKDEEKGTDHTDYKVDGYTLRQYDENLEKLANRPELATRLVVRHMAKSAFSIWDHYALRLKVAFATQGKDFKKKLADVTFSTIPFPQYNYPDFLQGYKRMLKEKKRLNTVLNFVAYDISSRRDYKLPTNILSVGATQIGKTTLFLDLCKRIYFMRGQPFDTSFLASHIVWTPQQGFTAFNALARDVIGNDEGYFVADRREAMSYINVKYLQLINILANKHNVTFTSIQDYTDIDQRIVKKADYLFLIYERGSAQVFARSHSFPIIQQSILDTENFEKNPNLLNDKDRAIYELKKKITYIATMRFWDFSKICPDIWAEYDKIKDTEQKAALQRISQTLESMEASKPDYTNMHDMIRMLNDLKKDQESSGGKSAMEVAAQAMGIKLDEPS